MFVSEILGKAAFDSESERFGTVRDLVVSPGDKMPLVSAVVLNTRHGQITIPASDVAAFAPNLVLKVAHKDAGRYEIGEEDLLLRKDVLDKQLVDVHDYRVVRVNDIRLANSTRGVRVVGVDAGWRGLLRRIGADGLASRILKLFRIRRSSGLISWDDVEPYERAGGKIRLKVPIERLAKLHPADIGNIINELDPAERKEVVERLDAETAADALQEADLDVQVQVLTNLEDEVATDILEEMEPDEAADLLGDLPAEVSEDLLSKMDQDDAEEVKELLAYEDWTAGGLMTNEFIAISADMTAQQVINHLREIAPDAETIYYIYVVDEDERLTGVLSLRDLIVAQPDSPVSDFVITEVIQVREDAEIEEITRLIGRYNLLALPVVDAEQRLLGIVTVDDALEQILPAEWRRGLRGEHK